MGDDSNGIFGDRLDENLWHQSDLGAKRCKISTTFEGSKRTRKQDDSGDVVVFDNQFIFTSQRMEANLECVSMLLGSGGSLAPGQLGAIY